MSAELEKLITLHRQRHTLLMPQRGTHQSIKITNKSTNEDHTARCWVHRLRCPKIKFTKLRTYPSLFVGYNVFFHIMKLMNIF